MPRARISRLSWVAVLPPTKRARISRLVFQGTVAAGVTKRARISRLLFSGVYASKKARISELRFTGSATQALVPSLVATPTVAEPGTLVTLSAADTTGGGVVTSWEITSGGAGLALVGTGLVQTLVAPRDYQGRTITVQVGYIDMFGVTATRSVTIVVRPQQLWFCLSPEVMIPVTHSFLRI